MCDKHNHGAHDETNRPRERWTGGPPTHGFPVPDGGEMWEGMTDDHPAVRHPDTRSSIYGEGEQTYTYVRELATTRYDYWDVWETLRDPDNRIIKGSELPFEAHGRDTPPGTQMWHKYLVNPGLDITQSLTMHTEILAPEGESQEHYHQNEAYMYILEGEGYEIHDGVEYQWEAGDLGVIHGGCVHQHHSADPDDPCKVLIVKPKALYQFLHLIYQGYTKPEPKEPAKDADWVPPELYYDVDGNVADNRQAHPRYRGDRR